VYGIDFRGGTLVHVKFSKAPNLDSIRTALDAQNIRNATLQGYGSPADHEVIIGLDLQATASSQELDVGKQAITHALASVYGVGPAGRIDFNNASPQAVAERLLAADPLHQASAGLETVTKTYRELADALVNFPQHPPRSGLIATSSN